MTSLLLSSLWIIAASRLAPWSVRRGVAWGGLIAAGIPILGLVTAQNGPWVGLLALVLGVVVLRYPLPLSPRRVGGVMRDVKGGVHD